MSTSDTPILLATSEITDMDIDDQHTPHDTESMDMDPPDYTPHEPLYDPEQTLPRSLSLLDASNYLTHSLSHPM